MKVSKVRYIVREAPNGVGKGLFAARRFKVGERIVEYTGRRISTAEADKLSSRYLFEIDKDWTIDAAGEENIARYINHSCDPNAESDVIDGHIYISALKEIKKGEEITFDYGEEYYDEFIRPHGCKCNAKKHR